MEMSGWLSGGVVLCAGSREGLDELDRRLAAQGYTARRPASQRGGVGRGEEGWLLSVVLEGPPVTVATHVLVLKQVAADAAAAVGDAYPARADAVRTAS